MTTNLRVISKVDRQRLKRALGKARSGAAPTPAGRVVVVHAAKGGVGASTLAAGLATVLSRFAGPVVLVDLALRSADQDLLWNLTPSLRISDVVGPEGHDLADALVKHNCGVRILAGPEGPAEAEEISPASIGPLLAVLSERHPSVVVDTSASFDEVTLAALETATNIVVPVIPELPAVRATQKALQLWERLGIPRERISIVLVDRKTDLDADTIARILGRPVSFRLPFVAALAHEAINAGEPIALTKPSGPYGQAVAAIAGSLLPKVTETALANISVMDQFFAWSRGVLRGLTPASNH